VTFDSQPRSGAVWTNVTSLQKRTDIVIVGLLVLVWHPPAFEDSCLAWSPLLSSKVLVVAQDSCREDKDN
jgi:hypothetical protein